MKCTGLTSHKEDFVACPGELPDYWDREYYVYIPKIFRPAVSCGLSQTVDAWFAEHYPGVNPWAR